MYAKILFSVIFSSLLLATPCTPHAAPEKEEKQDQKTPAATPDATPSTEPRTPIENELNRALRRSFDRARERNVRSRRTVYNQRTRIVITHNISAPLPANQDKGSVMKELRLKLYSQIGDECNALSEVFGEKRCHMSNLTIRPSTNSRLPLNEVHLTATVTYILD